MNEEVAAPDPEPRSPSGPLRRHGTKLFVSVLLGLGIAWVLVRGGLPLVPEAGAFAELGGWVVPAYVASLVAVHVFRAVRWRHLLRALGHVSTRNVLVVSWIAFGAILVSPFRSGEVVRPLLVTKRGDVKLWEATGTIAAERVIDGLVLSLILLAALSLATPLDPLPDHIGDLPVPTAAVPKAAYAALSLFVCVFALMTAFFFARELTKRAIARVFSPLSPALAEKLSDIAERLALGLRFLPSPRHLLPFLLETAAYWALNAGGIWLLARGCGLAGMTLAQACVVMGCLGIGILVPSGPGYFGAFQLSTYMALAMFFSETQIRGPGAAFVFLLYACQVGWHLVATAIGFVLDRRFSPDASENLARSGALR